MDWSSFHRMKNETRRCKWVEVFPTYYRKKGSIPLMFRALSHSFNLCKRSQFFVAHFFLEAHFALFTLMIIMMVIQKSRAVTVQILKISLNWTTTAEVTSHILYTKRYTIICTKPLHACVTIMMLIWIVGRWVKSIQTTSWWICDRMKKICVLGEEREKKWKFSHMILEKSYIDMQQICLVRFGCASQKYSGTICQRHNIINGMNQVHQLPYAHPNIHKITCHTSLRRNMMASKDISPQFEQSIRRLYGR